MILYELNKGEKWGFGACACPKIIPPLAITFDWLLPPDSTSEKVVEDTESNLFVKEIKKIRVEFVKVGL